MPPDNVQQKTRLSLMGLFFHEGRLRRDEDEPENLVVLSDYHIGHRLISTTGLCLSAMSCMRE